MYYLFALLMKGEANMYHRVYTSEHSKVQRLLQEFGNFPNQAVLGPQIRTNLFQILK